MREAKKKVLVIAVALMAVAMLALPMCTVCAKNNLKFIHVQGDMMVTAQGTLEFTPAGESSNQILVVTGNTMTWTGGIAGDADASGHFLAHNFGTPDAYSTARNIHTFTDAVVDGKQGDMTIITVGSYNQGHWRILSGTGELAGIHGEGTVWPIVAPAYWGYEGTVHFDP